MTTAAAQVSEGLMLKRLSRLRLLITRGLPLLFRPVAILAESALLDNGFLLVFMIPLVSMILLISSLPVHVQYFSELHRPAPDSLIARNYTASLTTIMLLSAVLLGIGMAAAATAPPLLILGTMVFYLTEKYFDELSRWFEFRRRFGIWFLIQSLRSAWLMIPIILAYFGMPYFAAFLIVVVAVLVGGLLAFRRVFGIWPKISSAGFALIREKWLFVLGTSLPAVYRQVPRLLVVGTFPSIAHIYVSTGQLVQVVALIFDVRVQIPYRRISVRRPRMFNRIWRSFLRVISLGSGVTGVLYIFGFSFLPIESMGPIALSAILIPIFTAEILVLASFTVNSGLVPWFVRPRQAFVTYSLCMVIYLAFAAVYYTFDIAGLGMQAVLLLPAINTLIGILWRYIFVARHFAREF